MSDDCDCFDVCRAIECGIYCACCIDDMIRSNQPQQTVIVQHHIQPVPVMISPANQGQYIAGQYVQSPGGHVTFVPVVPVSPVALQNVSPNPVVQYANPIPQHRSPTSPKGDGFGVSKVV